MCLQAQPYHWEHQPIERQVSDIEPPSGYIRLPLQDGSFGSWLRMLPLLPGGTPVHLYNGTLKRNQNAHFAVIDIDVGHANLQQCADAVIRLHAEYLFQAQAFDLISYDFTSGDTCTWRDWSQGLRPTVKQAHVEWHNKARPDESYANFRRFLTTVFIYAGTASLSRQLPRVEAGDMTIGDVVIQPGFPGHAVLVVDQAQNDLGESVFLLAQSYMPAQQIHILKGDEGPWYRPVTRILITPEWTFDPPQIYRLPQN